MALVLKGCVKIGKGGNAVDIEKLLGKLSNDDISKIRQMINTPAGQELISQLKSTDTTALKNKIKTMDINQLKQDKAIQQLANNPKVLKKINEFLDRM
ncbi:MAG: hypothetical protein PHF89_05310 [Eubacteriales bacterium]|jgi:hypothetical protein|nr:hypothetical protein [Eubacteriales bacterium]